MPYKNLKTKNEGYRRRRRLRREIVIAHYGGKCDCCGESHYEFLAIDHKFGGGTKHRKALVNFSKTAVNMAWWIIKNNFPPEFRILCHNCNQAIGFYGKCPHKI